jgi:hypothetical protein
MEASKGDFIYEFGNHGALLIMADWVHETTKAYFSTNQGYSWHTFEFSTTPMRVSNILTEWNAMSTKFVIFGTRGSTGHIYHLDFDVIRQRTCEGIDTPDRATSDYETWTPSDGKSDERCLLGRQRLYTRRKQLAECLNNKDETWPVDMKNCSCTDEDFECEVGFVRSIGSSDCLPEHASDFLTDDLGGLGVCATAATADVPSHRKVVGDTCQGGWRPEKFRLDCETIRGEAALEEEMRKGHHPTGRRRRGRIFFKLAVMFVLILSAVAAFFVIRSKTLRTKILSCCLGARAYSNVGDVPSAAADDANQFGASTYQAPSRPREMQDVVPA